MQFDRSQKINKVELKGYSRPIRLAFVVPVDTTERNQKILDKVFSYAYTCWAGARFLVIPVDEGGRIEDEYITRLDLYDADVIYSYASLSQDSLTDIISTNSPAYIVKHDFGPDGIYFSVSLDRYFRPISSLSTIHSPKITSLNTSFSYTGNTSIITQSELIGDDRFVTDNFGIQVFPGNVLHEVKGLFNTICLTPKETPENYIVGTERIHSKADLINRLIDKNVVTVSRLATVHSEDISTTYNHQALGTFSIFIGGSIRDRIAFWNLRSLYSEEYDCARVLILSENDINDLDLIRSLGGYLNVYNYIGGRQSSVTIRSNSVSLESLELFRQRLSESTFNYVTVSDDSSNRALSNSNQLEIINHRLGEEFTKSIFESPSIIEVPFPNHVRYIPPVFKFHAKGSWAIECHIERHNNLSRFINVADKWLLPKRAYISKCFGRQFCRISNNHVPVSFVYDRQGIFESHIVRDAVKLEISLPDDTYLIESLVTGRDDLQCQGFEIPVEDTKVKLIAESDKGKNFNGVVSMFDSMAEAAEFLTNKYWRKVFNLASKRDEREDSIFDGGKLYSLRPNGKDVNRMIVEGLNLKNDKQASQYITACYKDVLSFSIKKGILTAVYTWSCESCGHKNIRTVDSLNSINTCEICEYKHFVQVGKEFEWKYLLNKFIHKTLFKHHGLLVLWALNEIQLRDHSHSFLFLPEVNLRYDRKDSNLKNEIDFIGVCGGKFFIGEAKRSVDYFCDDTREVGKFISVVKELQPDIAYLVFEQYSESAENVENSKEMLSEIKVRFEEEFKGKIILSIMMFSNSDRYGWDLHSLGYSGGAVFDILTGWCD